WCDGRTTAECREIVERAGGEPHLREWVCNPALEGFTLPKVLWLRNHEPAAFARLATVLLAKDFVRLRLTGVVASEPSDASGTLMFDPGGLRWSREMLDAVELPRSLLPDVGGSAAVLGRVTEQAGALPGVPPGAEGVTFLPYLQGERTPHRDASLRAAFVGLSLAHSRAHMTRAVLEGVCFALRDCLAVLQELGLAPSCLLLTGGGARSAFIRRPQADVFGLPVTTVNREEGPAYGAALLAAVGVGAFPDLKAAVQCTLTRSPPTEPDRDVHGAYQAIYARFRASLAAAKRPPPS